MVAYILIPIQIAILKLINMQTNIIELGTIGVMTGIIMLGGFIYNLLHARESVIDGSFQLKKLVKENYVRYIYSLVVAFTVSFTLNWIPASSEIINGLTGNDLTMSSVGLLVFGIALAKGIFVNTKTKKQ